MTSLVLYRFLEHYAAEWWLEYRLSELYFHLEQVMQEMLASPHTWTP